MKNEEAEFYAEWLRCLRSLQNTIFLLFAVIAVEMLVFAFVEDKLTKAALLVVIGVASVAGLIRSANATRELLLAHKRRWPDDWKP